MKIILKGQVCGGKNNFGINPKTGKHYPKKNFKRWRTDVINQLIDANQVFTKPKFTKPCSFYIEYTAADRRKRDITAILDALWHVFERVNIVKDDSLLEDCEGFKKFYDKENPGVKITLKHKE